MAARDCRDCWDLVYTQCVSGRRLSCRHHGTDDTLQPQQSHRHSPVDPAWRHLKRRRSGLRVSLKVTSTGNQDETVFVNHRQQKRSFCMFHSEKTTRLQDMLRVNIFFLLPLLPIFALSAKRFEFWVEWGAFAVLPLVWPVPWLAVQNLYGRNCARLSWILTSKKDQK